MISRFSTNTGDGMTLTCLQFCILVRAVCRREPGAWAAFNQHMNACAICRDWEKEGYCEKHEN